MTGEVIRFPVERRSGGAAVRLRPPDVGAPEETFVADLGRGGVVVVHAYGAVRLTDVTVAGVPAVKQ